MPNFANMSSARLIGFLSNFITVASAAANEELLGYTAADITALNAEKAALQAAVNDQKTKQDAAKAATVALRGQLKTTRADMAARNRNIQGNVRVNAVLKAALGLAVPAPHPVKSNPVPPASLSVTGLPSGVNALQWASGGNAYGVQYVIEMKRSGADWERVDAVTARKYQHEGQTPGVALAYRVRARRRGLLSLPSNEAVVYAGGAASAAPVLRMAA